MWRAYKHVFRNVKRFLKYLFLYIGGMMLIAIAFAPAYFGCDSDPVRYSFQVMVGGVRPDTIASIMERVIHDVFVVLILGNYVLQRMKTSNPFEFSDHIVHNSKGFFFRYWVIRPQGRLVYNVSAKIVFINPNEKFKGMNYPAYAHKWEQTYNAVRGVRFCVIENEDADNLENQMGLYPDYIIQFYLQGQTETGNTYFAVREYKCTDIVDQAEFVSVRRSEYLRQINKKDSSDRGDYINFYNFDKMLICSENMLPSNKDILTDEQIYSEYPIDECKRFICKAANMILVKVLYRNNSRMTKTKRRIFFLLILLILFLFLLIKQVEGIS